MAAVPAGERIAVADLGTNSTRLLVGEVAADGRVIEIERRTTVTRLGEGVDESGRLAPEAMERVYAALAEYRQIAEATGATRLIAVATSAVRDAENGEELAAHVRDSIGFDLRTISGEEEARLTFLGATAGRQIPGDAQGSAPAPAHADDEVLVIDIGGGSTEFVVGRPGSPPDFHVSTRLGSVRHTERHLKSDPPRHEELEAMASSARSIIEEAVPDHVRARTQAGITVAGTPTSLAAIDQGLEPYDSSRVHGYRLSLATCERILAQLALLSLEERRQVKGLHSERAPTIVAGVAILVESMRLCGLDEIEVSELDVLHGVLLDGVAST